MKRTEDLQACHRLQIQSKNASEICDCWDTQAAAVEVDFGLLILLDIDYWLIFLDID